MPVTSTEPKFVCSSCGKDYRWKPELAGKKAKCKCGNVITVPSKPPAPAPARLAPKPKEEDADLDGLYALAQEEKKAVRAADGADHGAAAGYRCPSCSASMPPGAVICPGCQLDMRTGMRQPVAAARPGSGVLAAAGAYAAATATGRGGGAGVLPYGGGGGGAMSHAERASRDILYEGGKARSLYLPIGLIVLGLLFYFGQVAFANDKLGAGIMIGLVFLRVFIDSLLIFVAMLIAVKGFDMGFGAFGPGMLKILAVAMGPGALGQMVEEMMGGGFGGLLVGALVTLTLYGTLIKVLFNLDLGETLLLIFLIYGVRRVVGTFLMVAITGMASSGMISEDSADAIDSGATAVATAGPDEQHYPPKRTMDPEELAEDLDKGALATIRYNKGGSVADDYLTTHDEHRFSNLDKPKSLELVKALQDAGAKSVTCVNFDDVASKQGGTVSLVGGIVIEMPDDPASRKKIFEIRADTLKSVGQPEVMVEVEAGGKPDDVLKEEPLKDWGQKYMVLHFGEDKNAKPGDTIFSQRLRARMAAEEADAKAEAEAEGKAAESDAEGKAPEGEKATTPDATDDEEMSDEEPDDGKAATDDAGDDDGADDATPF